jgi:hypothetical protein
MHEIKHSAYAMLATVPSGEAIALTKPCRCSYKLNRAENLTGIVANVWCYEQVCLAEMFKLPKMLLANLLIARVIRWHG